MINDIHFFKSRTQNEPQISSDISGKLTTLDDFLKVVRSKASRSAVPELDEQDEKLRFIKTEETAVCSVYCSDHKLQTAQRSISVSSI